MRPADALDATTACQTADSRLGNALDVVPQDLAVALCASLSKSLPPLPRPDILFGFVWVFVLLEESAIKLAFVYVDC